MKCDNLAMSTKAEVEKALTGTDASGLRASFSHALSFAIPPLTLYCNYRSANSDLIFGVPLASFGTHQGNVPKAMRMCMEEVEKRGLDTENIYSVRSSRRIFEIILSSIADGYYIRPGNTTSQLVLP